MRSFAKKFLVVATSVLTVGTVVTFASSAYADTITVPADNPDGERVTRDLISKCDNEPDSTARTCKWINVTAKFKDGLPTIVGDGGGEQKYVNCGAGEFREMVSWTRTTGHSTTVGGSVTIGGALKELFSQIEAFFTGGVDHTWSRERTYAHTTDVQVPVGETAWIVHTEKMLSATGTLEVTSGPNTWVLAPTTIDAPHATMGGAISVHTRKHTLADRAVCDLAPKPDGLPSLVRAPLEKNFVDVPLDETPRLGS